MLNSDREWLYLLICPGQERLLDVVIHDVVSPILAQERATGIDRWFFIRYLDQIGPHIRLRIRGEPGELENLRTPLANWVTERVNMIARTPPPAPARLLPVPAMPDVKASTKVLFDRYEPEYDKYGGAVGVAIAEELFQASSELVLQLFARGYPDIKERGLLAVILMRAVAAVGLQGSAGREALWERCHNHWLSGPYAESGLLRQRMREAARRRLPAMEKALAAFGEHRWVRDLCTVYEQAVETAFRRISSEPVGVSTEELCFHFIHMMNNRLGLWPLEESYLAAFLLNNSDD